MEDNCMEDNCMDDKCESIDPDILVGSSISKCGLIKNGLVLRPVAGSESGNGLPYAPVDWPRPGDIWRWKAGSRKKSNGFWRDRRLYLPTRLHKSIQKRNFKSKLSVERYIREEFPDADINAFFSSFSWSIPSADATVSKGESTISGISSTKQMNEHSLSELKVGTVECKAGNWMCRLQLKARKYSLPAMDCDICCSEVGFCRDCCCILCCGIVDWSYGAYSFIRCEAKVNDNYICGHVAHINCALRSNMAGTVGGDIGLDVEYYCRRCDKRSDLIIHATRLLQICESLDSRDDIEKILNVGLCILGGSKQERSKPILHLIKLALAKLKNGTSLEDLWKLEGNMSAASAGDMSSAAMEKRQLQKKKDAATGEAALAAKLLERPIEKPPTVPYSSTEAGQKQEKLLEKEADKNKERNKPIKVIPPLSSGSTPIITDPLASITIDDDSGDGDNTRKDGQSTASKRSHESDNVGVQFATKKTKNGSWEDPNFVVPADRASAMAVVREMSDVPPIRNIGIVTDLPSTIGHGLLNRVCNQDSLVIASGETPEDSLGDCGILLSELATRLVSVNKAHVYQSASVREAHVRANTLAKENAKLKETLDACAEEVKLKEGELVKKDEELVKFKTENQKLRTERKTVLAEMQILIDGKMAAEATLEEEKAARMQAEDDLAKMRADFSDEF